MKLPFLAIGTLLLLTAGVASCSSLSDITAGPSCITLEELKPQMKELSAKWKRGEDYSISACAYLRYGFEDKNLLSRLDRSKAECISAWPLAKPGLIKRLQGLHGQYVRVTGHPWEHEDQENYVSFSHCSVKEGFVIESVERASPPGGFEQITGPQPASVR